MRFLSMTFFYTFNIITQNMSYMIFILILSVHFNYRHKPFLVSTSLPLAVMLTASRISCFSPVRLLNK